MYTRIEGENSLDALMHLIDKITRMPDVPKRKRHGYESTRSVGTGELIRTSEFDTIYDTIKFINPNHVFPEACTPEMKEAGALFLDEMAKIFNESNIFKRRSGVLSKEIVIDYTYGPGGALSTPTITSPSASELRKDFGRSSINKFANALVTSLQAFQDTTNGGKLKPGDGITDNTTSKPPTSGGGFAITFPIAFYETKDQEDERLINEHNVVIELSDLIKKLAISKPEIVSHNMETVKRLTRSVRIQARYERSLEVLKYLKLKGMRTKTGIMLGLGETEAEVIEAMEDLVAVGLNVLTLGQYLQPTPKHLPVKEFISPDFSGIRTKTLNNDFIIHDHKDHNIPGIINLYGIDSPGVTSSIPLGEYVANKCNDYLESSGVSPVNWSPNNT